MQNCLIETMYVKKGQLMSNIHLLMSRTNSRQPLVSIQNKYTATSTFVQVFATTFWEFRVLLEALRS